MKVKYESKRPKIQYGFINCTFSQPNNLWFTEGNNKIFDLYSRSAKVPYGSHSRPIRSVKAFRRFIAKNIADIPIGSELVLVSRWVGRNVIFTRTK